MPTKKSIQEKKQHALLDLKRVNIKLGELSERIFFEMIKKKNITSVKKMSWKIRKIITQEGEYIPEKDCSVILVSYANSKQKVKRIKISKRKIHLPPKK